MTLCVPGLESKSIGQCTQMPKSHEGCGRLSSGWATILKVKERRFPLSAWGLDNLVPYPPQIPSRPMMPCQLWKQQPAWALSVRCDSVFPPWPALLMMTRPHFGAGRYGLVPVELVLRGQRLSLRLLQGQADLSPQGYR